MVAYILDSHAGNLSSGVSGRCRFEGTARSRYGTGASSTDWPASDIKPNDTGYEGVIHHLH